MCAALCAPVWPQGGAGRKVCAAVEATAVNQANAAIPKAVTWKENENDADYRPAASDSTAKLQLTAGKPAQQATPAEPATQETSVQPAQRS